MGPSLDTRLPLPFPWSSPKERKALIFRFKRDAKAAQVKNQLFRVQKTKPNETLITSVTTKHSLSLFRFSTDKESMGLKGAPAAATGDVALSSSDDVVVKSPNDSRLYRLVHLKNGLQALIVHDPEIYPEGAPKDGSVDEDDEDEEDDEEDDDECEDDEDEEEEDEDEDEDEEDGEGREGGKGAANQSKKVAFL